MIWRNKNKIIASFGAGDIAIEVGISGSKEVGIIALSEIEPREIGDRITAEDGVEHQIMLTFSKIESVDVLIKSLEEMKKVMESKGECWGL